MGSMCTEPSQCAKRCQKNLDIIGEAFTSVMVGKEMKAECWKKLEVMKAVVDRIVFPDYGRLPG